MSEQMGGTLYIVMPAYNEQENIEKQVGLWYKAMIKLNTSERSRLVVVNDGSTDRTGEILKRMAVKYPQMVVINKKNGGHGSAVLTGYRYAVKNSADWIFQTDSDGQVNPDVLSAVWEKSAGKDAVIGCRKDRQDGTMRKFIERVLCTVLLFEFHTLLPDANAPCRLISRSAMQAYLDVLPETVLLPNAIQTAVLHKYFNIEFVPIAFGVRAAGTQKMNLRKAARTGLASIREFRIVERNIAQRREAEKKAKTADAFVSARN